MNAFCLTFLFKKLIIELIDIHYAYFDGMSRA